ncbi:sensor domain-containing diguanylate cyclase [Bacillus suaedaesalsae]|uniref:GGDEF domain-containing protein n=1 Tax=Bacillus suaedaesalsae TaxID=2810349 RepID=A0ABS2DG68_9BACI|nr:diguanylate cyclase [Bacillus suaedaesalsae]MBM6617025.1 GGDEF domain-containing protein [Bacillus suaedaesalsae]
MSITVRTYFVVILSIFVIVLTSFLTYTISKESSTTLEKQIGESLSSDAMQIADNLDHFMWARYGEISLLKELELLKNPKDIKEVEKLLNELQTNFPSFSWVGYTDKDGVVQAATDNVLVGQNISERPVFKEARYQTFIGDVHEAVLLAELLPNPTGEPLKFVDISSPIFNENNEFIGVLAAHMSWTWTKEVSQSVLKPTKQKKDKVDVLIVSKIDNTVLLGPNELLGQKLDINAVNKAQSGKNDWSIEKWPDGKHYLTGYALADGMLNYPGLNWSVIVRQPEAIAFHSSEQLKTNVIVLGLLSTVLFATIGWYLAGIISNPLRKIAMTADLLRKGEKVEIPYNKGIKDIEILSRSLRELLATLTKTESELDKMEQLAHLDKLTGLHNRLALELYLKKLSPNATFAFLYIDLDGFKLVNDNLGHHHGDVLLQAVANRLKKAIRENEHVFRLGGDEFVTIIETTNLYEHSTIVGKRIIQSINDPFTIEGNNVQIGCSIGCAFYPMDDLDPNQVLRYADQALYRSKDTGKNKISFFKS